MLLSVCDSWPREQKLRVQTAAARIKHNPTDANERGNGLQFQQQSSI